MDYGFQRENRFPPLYIQKLIFQKLSLMSQALDEAREEKPQFTGEVVSSVLQSHSDEWALGGTPQKQGDSAS